jgi:hypothetical protein
MSLKRMCPASLLIVLVASGAAAHAHEPTPDPILSYTFARQHLADDEAGRSTLTPQFGPTVILGGKPLPEDAAVVGLRFAGLKECHQVAAEDDAVRKLLPQREFTISAWVTVDHPMSWGGIFSALQDNGGAEKGLVLGYDKERFFIGLATAGGSDEDGRIEYLRSTVPYAKSRWHHVAATYDGDTLHLFVNGEAVAQSDAQSGDILWPDDIGIWLGGYRDVNESNVHQGRIGSVKLFRMCAQPSWVAHEFEHGADLVALPADGVASIPLPIDATPEMVIKPYLQWGTADSMTIMWETAHACRGIVRYGLDAGRSQEVREPEPRTIHEVTLTGLEADMLYYYSTLSPPEGELPDADETLTIPTDLRTFQTSAPVDSPVAFTVICDSQAQPEVVKRVAEAMWEFRPQFALLGGDLVTTGTNKKHWTDHYFPNMDPLSSRVVVYPVLGNHEQNANHYYNYMHLPEPEYYYTFRRGQIQFFMIDSNKDLSPGSEQYAWLDEQLADSDARWKICMHHHPPFSSDDDYGNDWKKPLTAMNFGDTNAKQLVTLYDKHAVDIVWNGHIHSYERSWMLRAGKPVQKGGTVYMITGGAGGHLETFGPYRPAFQHRVRRGHHFSYVTCFGDTLDIKAFDDAGQLFDHAVLTKAPERSD